MGPRPFLTAAWRHLAMAHFDVDPRLLREAAPPGTEPDDWNGRAFVSLVGFLFLDVRVLGVPVPLHRRFEEVNLRFYVRRRTDAGWRRGVAFVKEIVPRRAVAWTARAVYGERYVTLPMSHHLEGDAEAPGAVAYGWRFRGTGNRLRVVVDGPARMPEAGSLEEFLVDHAWGYVRRRGGGATEYRVEHPPWRLRTAKECVVACDVATLYGEEFREPLSVPPASAFLADGSDVAVFRGSPLR